MCSILYSVLCQPVHMWACIYEHDRDLLIQLSYMWRFKSLVLEFRCYMWSDTHTSISDAHVLVQEASKPVAKLLLRIHSKTPCSSASSLHHLSMCSDKKRKSITTYFYYTHSSILTSKAVVMSLESRTTGSGCVFCLIGVEKLVGRESELSTASR